MGSVLWFLATVSSNSARVELGAARAVNRSTFEDEHASSKHEQVQHILLIFLAL